MNHKEQKVLEMNTHIAQIELTIFPPSTGLGFLEPSVSVCFSGSEKERRLLVFIITIRYKP